MHNRIQIQYFNVYSIPYKNNFKLIFKFGQAITKNEFMIAHFIHLNVLNQSHTAKSTTKSEIEKIQFSDFHSTLVRHKCACSPIR